ncbi:MAG: NAD(P)/FAD-dependent oxidoreductase [bacterium]|nr:NAD(P)/FAD-dependent oxidoreductase [bacterium]
MQNLDSRAVYDVAVIGASVAGSTVATLLGRAGLDVLLCDKKNFPRNKPCGEGISSLGVRMLSELGITESSLSGREKNNYGLYRIWSKGKAFVLRAPSLRGVNTAMGVRRLLLDDKLLERAKSFPSVELLEGQGLKAVVDDGRYYVVTLDKQEIKAKYLVVADGAYSHTAIKLGIPLQHGKLSRFGYSYYAKGKAKKVIDSVSVLLEPGLQVFCTMTGTEEMTVSIVGNKNALHQVFADEALSVLHKEIELCTGFAIEEYSAPAGAGYVDQILRPPYRGRTFLVGDAVRRMDPAGGMGITHALGCGFLCASGLVEVLRRGRSCAEAGPEYENRQIRFSDSLARLTYINLLGLTCFTRYRFMLSLLRLSFLQHLAEHVSRTILSRAEAVLVQAGAFSSSSRN